LNPDDVPLIMDSEIVTTNDVVLQRLAELPRNAGDCTVDYLQGLYWNAKNRELLAWETPSDVSDGEPVICCGSGPSLDAAIPQLRELQRSYRIVCAHSTIEKLLKADIIPDAFTPLERIDPTVIGMPMHALPEQVVYAGLAVVPNEHRRCTHKYSVTSCGLYTNWLPSAGKHVSQGTMSGTLAAGVSLALTSGPVYLIGHDLARGHYAGYAYTENESSHEVEGVDGERRPTDFFMNRSARELGNMSLGRLVQCAPAGAVLANSSTGVLPQPRNRAKTIRYPTRVDPWRVDRFAETLRLLPQEWRAGMLRLAKAECAADISIPALWPDARNRDAFKLLLRPVYLALSIEKRAGHSAIVVDWFKEIMANMDHDIAVTFEDIAHDAE
jgi:hypothetical protein